MSLLALSINPRGPLYRKQLEREAAERDARRKAYREADGAARGAAIEAAWKAALAPKPAPVVVRMPARPAVAPVDPSTFPRADLSIKGAPVSRAAAWAIMEACSAHFDEPINDMLSRRRFRRAKLALHVSIYLTRVRLGASLLRLGQMFGDRDHSTIIHALKRIEELIAADDQITIAALLAIETALAQGGDDGKNP